MFCSSCGVALSQPMKYCKHCGTKLVTTQEAAEITPSEERLDDYLEGIFWTPVLSLGLILGGLALMKKGLHLSERLITAYIIVSSTVFLISFVLQLWGLLRLVRNAKKVTGALQAGGLETNELGLAKARTAFESAPSVTETTTRRLKPLSKELIT